MTFIVNGADWSFSDLETTAVEARIDRFLDFVRICFERNECILIGDDFQSRPMHGAFTLWELFAEHSPLDLSVEVAQELTAWLQRAQFYADAPDWPEGIQDSMIAVGGAPLALNQDVAWAHYLLRSGKPTSCTTLGPSQILDTSTASGSISMHFVGDEAGRVNFWRSAIKLEGDNLMSLVRYAEHAYPSLYFVDGVLSNADHLGGGYTASRHRVCMALSVLNDWGFWTFRHPPPSISPDDTIEPHIDAQPSNQLIQNRLSGFGVVAAPENPNVRSDGDSRRARETKVGGVTIYCEWHIKLEPHRNRIHFHAPVPESGNRVVIGMIDEHLPLPG